MKEKIIQTYCQKTQQYKILDRLKVDITVENNPYNIPIDGLFSMAARKNRKRGFLFVSKVLGKHLPVNPYIPLVAGVMLSMAYKDQVEDTKDPRMDQCREALLSGNHLKEAYEAVELNPISLEGSPLVIGFAETATALGASFATGLKTGDYIHTTRDEIKGMPSLLNFEEEHSHATTHRLYLENKALISDERPIIFVDDEITTGRTTLNIIKAMQARYPRKTYTIVSLLDWRSEADRRYFKEIEEELNITIHTVSLVSGNIKVEGTPIEEEQAKEAMKVNLDIPVVKHSIDQMEILDKFYVDDTCYLKGTGRFGINHQDQKLLHDQCRRIGEDLKSKRVGKNTLCLGMGEFMHIPMLIGTNMGEGVLYHSTTRSPIHPVHKRDYAIHSALQFNSCEHIGVQNFCYNIPFEGYDDVFYFSERSKDDAELASVIKVLKTRGFKQINIIECAPSGHVIPYIGSYRQEDVTFLLKDLSHVNMEQDTKTREEAIQRGVHYSEMLPIEYQPGEAYMTTFYQSLERYSGKVAKAVGIVAEKIIKNRGTKIVLVSLARAGTPIGVLIRRYLQQYYNLEIPHYSISIIRGKGIDENAMSYIVNKYQGYEIQFIDGWTGKGAISKVLHQACMDYERIYGVKLSDDLAVLADPAICTQTFGTREDFLIPSACLNSTVSGLVSRTILREDLIGEEEFHGTKFYKELKQDDVSMLYVQTITNAFEDQRKAILDQVKVDGQSDIKVTWSGLKDVERLKEKYGMKDINLIKPGIGETTRVLLRRIPWKVIVRDKRDKELEHILILAKEKKVEIIEDAKLTYRCCGLIKPLGGEC